MKRFGRFLVEKGLITEEALLQALVRQVEELPCVQSIVQESKVLSVQEQLATFERQWQTGAEFRRSALELGFWSDHLQQEVRQRLVAKRKPLGQLLVEQGKLTLDQLTKALDEFVAAAAPKDKIETAPKLETTASEQGVSPQGVLLYLSLFDEDMHLRLQQADDKELRALIPPLAFVSRKVGLADSHEAWRELERSLAPATLERLWALRAALVERKAA